MTGINGSSAAGAGGHQSPNYTRRNFSFDAARTVSGNTSNTSSQPIQRPVRNSAGPQTALVPLANETLRGGFPHPQALSPNNEFMVPYSNLGPEHKQVIKGHLHNQKTALHASGSGVNGKIKQTLASIADRRSKHEVFEQRIEAAYSLIEKQAQALFDTNQSAVDHSVGLDVYGLKTSNPSEWLKARPISSVLGLFMHPEGKDVPINKIQADLDRWQDNLQNLGALHQRAKQAFEAADQVIHGLNLTDVYQNNYLRQYRVGSSRNGKLGFKDNFDNFSSRILQFREAMDSVRDGHDPKRTLQYLENAISGDLTETFFKAAAEGKNWFVLDQGGKFYSYGLNMAYLARDTVQSASQINFLGGWLSGAFEFENESSTLIAAAEHLAQFSRGLFTYVENWGPRLKNLV